ncbi:diguanylate phosphodiesterase [Spirochaetia bacterium]|nr:diguanylate phosphodiesterase [Spirochaetia bacterium]
MKMKKKLACTSLVLTLLLSVLTACGNKDAKSDAGSKTVKDSLRIAHAFDSKLMSFGTTSTNQGSVPLMHNIYDTLVTFDHDHNIVPQLATEWSVSDDGMRYSFTIRKGVTFHDGSPLTMEDIAWTYDYLISTTLGPNLLINYDHTEIVDENHIIMHMKAPYGAFLNGAASRAGLIMSKKYFDKVGVEVYENNPIGTGPYKFISKIPGDSIKLEFYPGYWGGELPIKTVEFKYITDPNTQMISLESGDVDLVLLIPTGSMLQLKDNPNIGIAYETSATRVGVNPNCNPQLSIGGDINFRKAIAYYVNKEDMVTSFTEGLGEVADSPIQPNYSGRPEKYNTIQRDVNKAKEFLAASTYKGQPVKIVCSSDYEMISNILQAQLLEIGINAQVVATDDPTMEATLKRRDYDISVFRRNSSLIDADGLWTGYSEHFKRSSADYGYERLPEMETLLWEGRSMQETPERREVYRKLQDIIIDEVYEVPLVYTVNTAAFHKNLKGVWLNFVQMFPIKDMYWE